MRPRRSTSLFALGLAASLTTTAAAVTFERDVLPLFEKHCLECHGGDATKGDLDLRTLASVARGGESGDIVRFGDSHASPLFEKVKSGDMPPEKRTKLNADELHVVEKWINTSAAPTNTPPAVAEARAARRVFDLLELKCLPCHSDRKQEGKLDLRTVETMLQGGKSGPALLRGDPEKSQIIAKIREDIMPPREHRNNFSIKPVTEGELNLLRRWIHSGAAAPPPVPVIPDDDVAQIKDSDRAWWSFQPPQAADPPARGGAPAEHRKLPPRTTPARTPADAFLLAKLEEKGLSFSPEAAPRTLVRRAYFAVTGLPPTPAEVAAFLLDRRPDAYERLVDKLLASPRYGEHWGQTWLDAAGYADSEGAVNEDPVWEEFWRYRDYVIRSLNDDKPFDRFLTEQLAGDELADYRNASVITPELADNLVATGFLRGGVDPTMNPAMNFTGDRHQVVADKIEMLGSAVFGLTLHCARCHSHKYDPVTQRDYYRLGAVLAGAFAPMDWRKPDERYLPLVPAAAQREVEQFNAAVDAEKKPSEQALDELRKKHKAALLERKIAGLPAETQKQLRELAAIPVEKRTELQKTLAEKYAEQLKAGDPELGTAFPEFKARLKELTAEIDTIGAKKRKYDRAFGLTDVRADPLPFYFHRRGDPFDRAGIVPADVPAVLRQPGNPFTVTPPWTNAPTSGRRLALSRWLTHPSHPLTARVFVNRVWQRYFGRGLVETPENFGHIGVPPTHPELLDWLAVTFVKEGWSQKKLHRLILTSTAFRQQSKADDAGMKADPENKLLWRMPLQRLDAESVRDAVLACSGVLRLDMFGPPVPVTIAPDGQVTATNAPEMMRRSIYLLHRRSKPVTMLEMFDAPQLSINCTRRPLSNVVSQPLLLFNSEFMAGQAAKLAERVETEASRGMTARIEWLHELLFNRLASREEQKSALDFFEGQTRHYQHAGGETESSSRDALTDLCLVLFNAAEFIYVE